MILFVNAYLDFVKRFLLYLASCCKNKTTIPEIINRQNVKFFKKTKKKKPKQPQFNRKRLVFRQNGCVHKEGKNIYKKTQIQAITGLEILEN